ncbi:lysoplasmalogenase [Hyphococcus sp.]|uniref:lysoplasmalogenase n=1 Tax=Hyphococcus sp. TaxID=2038636 RepID=UPI003CCBC818
MPTIGFILACLVFTGALIWAEYRGNARLRWRAKPAASLAFIFVAVASGAPDSVFGQWVLAALLLCAAGDILLIPDGEKTFLAGMGAFALGHAAYIAGFLSGGASPGFLFFAAAIAMAVFVVLALGWLWPHLGRFRWPVTAYSTIIAVMTATSVLASPPDNRAVAMVVAGAVGFAVSDLAVARDQFVARNFFNKLWGLPLYYGAQLLLATSVYGPGAV